MDKKAIKGVMKGAMIVDDLLYYTGLGMADVFKRVGFGSAKNLYLIYMREFGIAPSEHRQKIREEGNVWRYKL